MKDDNAGHKTAILEKLDEISRLTESMKARVSDGNSDIGGDIGGDISADIRELDHLVHELKVSAGQSSFDRTAYQREYMRRKRKESPEYRPIIGSVRDIPDWRKPPLK